AGAERLPVDDASVDTVVSTLVLCSVRDPKASLAEVVRVLRPGGRLLFLEHVASDDPRAARWQRWLQPLWRWLADNCHLTRRTGDLIRESGGTAIAVTDEEMIACAKEIASKTGVFACPEGGATLAAYRQLVADGFLNESQTIVLLNTGSGVKYLEALGQ
ncbi:MAG: pyridoxal-phosphate dependent enzyme, partial [Armatimonadetes bacterium]|nr:pyridoxal-phosphate dependent enzyme [Armatimonadota bacterium]